MDSNKVLAVGGRSVPATKQLCLLDQVVRSQIKSLKWHLKESFVEAIVRIVLNCPVSSSQSKSTTIDSRVREAALIQ